MATTQELISGLTNIKQYPLPIITNPAFKTLVASNDVAVKNTLKNTAIETLQIAQQMKDDFEAKVAADALSDAEKTSAIQAIQAAAVVANDAFNEFKNSHDATISAFQTDLVGIHASIDTTNANVSAVQSDVANIQAIISANSEQVAVVASALQGVISDVQVLTNAINAVIEPKLAEFQASFDSIIAELATKTAEITDLSSRLTVNEALDTQQGAEIDTLQSDVATVQSDINDLKNNALPIQATQNGATYQVSSLKRDVFVSENCILEIQDIDNANVLKIANGDAKQIEFTLGTGIAGGSFKLSSGSVEAITNFSAESALEAQNIKNSIISIVSNGVVDVAATNAKYDELAGSGALSFTTSATEFSIQFVPATQNESAKVLVFI